MSLGSSEDPDWKGPIALQGSCLEGPGDGGAMWEVQPGTGSVESVGMGVGVGGAALPAGIGVTHYGRPLLPPGPSLGAVHWRQRPGQNTDRQEPKLEPTHAAQDCCEPS